MKLLKEQTKEKLAVKRETGIEKMKEQHEKEKKMEDTVLRTGVKLQTIKQENDRFIKVINYFY